MGSDGLLGGRYRLDHVAGHGGMATVFSAHDSVLDRTVAIKLLQHKRDDGKLRERFEREAKAEARIVHPNVVSVHDIGENDDGRPFFVMDYVEGRSLQEMIAEDAPLSSEVVANIGAGIASALAAAHAHAIVHRDVKPANVIVDAEDNPHLMDFGLARELESDDDPAITAPGVLVGTAYYVAPEQARHGTASPAGDLYSLGAVLYHALTGEPPFSGENALDVALRRFEEDPAEVRDLVPAADPELAALIHELLEREPENRPADAAAVAERLRDVAARLRATRTAG